MKKKIGFENYIFSLIPGFLSALFCVVGFVVKREHGFSLTFGAFFAIVALTAVFSAIYNGLYKLLDLVYKKSADADKKSKNSDSNSEEALAKKESKANNENVFSKNAIAIFVISFFALILIWLPSFLALYPGIFAYDNQWQYFMFVDHELTNHQPLIHTIIFAFIIQTVEKATGSFNKGVAAYTIVQMLIMAAGCAYIPYLLIKRSGKLWQAIAATVFFAFYPVFVIFVFTGTKDSIFAVAVADFIALNIYFCDKKEEFFENKLNPVLWVIFALTILFLRNNAVYPMIIILPFFIIFCMSKKHIKAMIIMIAVTSVFYIVYTYPVTNALCKEKVSTAEMLSVPCQQMMRVYKYKNAELSDADKAEFEKFYDMEKWYGTYVPEIADASKGSLRVDEFSNNKSEFISLYTKWLRQYPNEYVDSFLENTYGFFYMWPKYVIYSYGDEGYTVIEPMQPTEANSKIPVLKKFYKQFENGKIVNGYPVISWLFAPATFMLVALFVIMNILRNKKYKLLIPTGYVALLWMTYLLGPVAMVRYALFLIALVPVWIMYIDLANNKD